MLRRQEMREQRETLLLGSRAVTLVPEGLSRSAHAIDRNISLEICIFTSRPPSPPF